VLTTQANIEIIKMKIGITGQAGFVGSYLYNYLGIKDKIVRIPFEDSFFDMKKKLEGFVQECDVIVHLAALNRHEDSQVIYNTNINLVKSLIDACHKTGSSPHILFSSSTQEDRDNMYGRSKKDGRLLLESWAQKNNTQFTGLVIPNVFGPFGIPYYNSFIATFCHQLTHGETPEIHVDENVKLIFVHELVEKIFEIILNRDESDIRITRVDIPHTKEGRVSEILTELKGFKSDYFERGILPDLDDTFTRNLFNTLLCYIDHKKFFPFNLKLNTDDRGSFVEVVKLKSGGQVSYSTTVPGITRGNHYHTRKAERFVVIKGKARIEIRRIGTKEILSFELDGKSPSFVDMPIWYTHNITNIGDEELYTIFWINELYDADDGDTYFEKV
jgi:UDP-2-acetamido-2,6-beta-L-arabino-hexul-4-ose reductase